MPTGVGVCHLPDGEALYRHHILAWTTLATLMLTDMYIWFVAAGYINDLRIIG